MDDDPGHLAIQFEITTISAHWNISPIDLEIFFRYWTITAFNHLSIVGNFEISVVLCDDNDIEKINTEFRNKNKPTNILSFQSGLFNNVKSSQPNYVCPLGDIVLSFTIIKTEAESQNKRFNDHLCHLWIHGLLHLIGYDHEIEDEIILMESMEIEILKLMKINNPYKIAGEISEC